MKRTTMCIVLSIILLGSVTPGRAAPEAADPASVVAAPRAQGGSVSNSFGDPGDAYMEFTISGGDLKLREGTPASYEGPWNGGPITLSGKMTVDRTHGTKSWVTMSANVADQSFQWPPEGEDSEVADRVVSQSFNLTFNVPPDYEGSAVTGRARLEVCGGVCGVYSVDFRIDLPALPDSEEPAARTPEPSPSPTPEPQYRLTFHSSGPADPLRLTLRLEKQESAGADATYQPVPDAQLRVAALAHQGNERRLADEFVAPACQNCEWRAAGGDKLAHLQAPDQLLLVQTDGQGEAKLAFFLDFAKLGEGAPLGGTPLAVPVAAEYWMGDGQGGERLKARVEQTISMDAIAVVTAITYEQAQMYDVGNNPLPRNQGPLDSYYDDPGTRDGSRVLSRDGRVRLARYGTDYMGQPGQTLGDPLVAGDLLRVGDQVTINACDMVTNRIVNGLPAGAPGVVWVKVRFFDGLRAKVGVNGGVCRTTVMFGQSPAASGWLGSGGKFFYWSVNGAANAVIGHYFWPYKIVSGLSSVGKTLAWLLGNEAAGWDPVYIKVKSALVVEFDEAGVMQVTTREGEPEVLTQATGAEGVLVPVGKTARVTDARAVEVQDTDPETALRTDELLAGLDPLSDVTGTDLGDASNDPSVPLIGDGPAAGSLAVPLVFGGGGLLLILLLGGLLLVMKKSKGGPSHPAENDWMEDVPSGTTHASIPAPAGAGAAPMRGGSGRSDEQNRWHLLVVEGPDAGRRHTLDARTRLGRSSDNEVHLHDPQASRQHALVQQTMNGCIISDQGSSNGTFVNGTRIAEPTRLREGDLIRIGNTTLELVAAEPGPEAVRTAPASHSPSARPPAAGSNYCPNCGHALMPGARFCAICGASLGSVAASAPAAYQPVPVPASAPSSESAVSIIPAIERRKGLFGSEAFSLILTPDRLVFARLTSEMLKAAAEQARQSARAQGKGLLGQWGAVLGSSSALTKRYLQMPVEAILREHPDNFQIPIHQVRKVQVRHGYADENQSNPDELVIHAGDKIKFNLKGTSAGEARKALRQVLGDRVK